MSEQSEAEARSSRARRPAIAVTGFALRACFPRKRRLGTAVLQVEGVSAART